MISATVYLLCALTSLLCTVLLSMRYFASRTPLLGWSSVCFLCLTVQNSLLFVDLVIVPDCNLSVLRTVPAVLGFGLLVWGFIWEEKS